MRFNESAQWTYTLFAAMTAFHPDLTWHARLVPRLAFTPRILSVVRALAPRDRRPRSANGIRGSLHAIPGATTARVFEPDSESTVPRAAMLYVHGGGYILGSPGQCDPFARMFVRDLGITVVLPTYRLAPEHPFPAALDDLYAALKWLYANAESLGVRRDRIVVAGQSAGGGLAAALTLMARDRGEIPIAFQHLVYPMLDDRTVSKTIDGTNHRMWSATSNRFGWTSYLGREPGSEGISPYAAPARAESLAGLPPTWIGVGTNDLFHDEDIEYARRLEAAGVPVELEIVPGAFHGFDVFAGTGVAKAFGARQVEALRRVL